MSEMGQSILTGLQEALAHARGAKTGAHVHVPPAVDVAQIRKKIAMTQHEFSKIFCIPLATLRKWEQHQRTPQGTARILLIMIDRNPKAVLETLKIN